jgi:hypothetical protein
VLTEQGLSLDATWRLSSQTNLQYEYLALDKRNFHAVSMNITALNQQQLFVNYFKIESPELDTQTYFPKDDLINNLLTIDHGMNISAWNIQSRLTSRPQAIVWSQLYGKRLLRRLSFRGGYSISKTAAEGVKFNAVISSNTNIFDSKNIQVSLESEDDKFVGVAGYRLQGGAKVNTWDLDSRLRHTFGQKTTLNLSATWRYKEDATLSFITDGKSFGLKFNWNGASASLNPDLNFKYFGSGTVYGNIQAPEKDGVPSGPITGCELHARQKV